MLQENIKKNRFWWRPNRIIEEIELEEKTEKRIDGIEKLKINKEEELRNLFIIDNGHTDFLLELNANKRDIQEELILIGIRLEKCND